MKKYLITAAVLAATVTAAEAKCSKPSLNGTWLIAWGSMTTVVPATFNNGNVTIPLLPATGTYTMAKSCKGTMSLTGVPIPFKLAAERIDPESALKPNHMNLTYDAGGGSGLWFPMTRL